MDEPRKLAALTAACALLDSTLAEREPHPETYDLLNTFIDGLLTPQTNPYTILRSYALLELNLLSHLGFGLDFTECAATGTTGKSHLRLSKIRLRCQR